MRLKYFGLWLLVIMFSLSLSGCFEDKNDYSKQGVCVVDNTSLRSEPSTKGKWISALALGETVKLDSGPVQDPADPKVEYIKVKLSDGTKGYASTWCIIRGAYVGVIQATAKIYKRPDLLAESNKQFELMNIVAVEEEKDDWIRVTGEKQSKSGWIQSDSIRKDKEDIVTAIQLRKALQGKGDNLPREEMEAIVSKLQYQDNYFVNEIMKKYEDKEIDEEDNFEGEFVDTDDSAVE